MAQKLMLRLHVNGERRSLAVAPSETLGAVLSGELSCGSVREACDDGACGCCLVSVDGTLVHSCLLLAVQADGAQVLTAEGVPERGIAARIRRVVADAPDRCPDCAGMLVVKTADGVRRRLPDSEIRQAILEQPCRCGTAERIWPALEELLGARRAAAAAAERVAVRRPRRARAAPSRPAPV